MWRSLAEQRRIAAAKHMEILTERMGHSKRKLVLEPGTKLVKMD